MKILIMYMNGGQPVREIALLGVGLIVLSRLHTFIHEIKVSTLVRFMILEAGSQNASVIVQITSKS